VKRILDSFLVPIREVERERVRDIYICSRRRKESYSFELKLK